MLPRGRPPGPGTAEEKAAIRREKVRLNVKAYRERKKNALAAVSKSPSSLYSHPSPTDSSLSSVSSSTRATSVDQHNTEDDQTQIAIRSKRQPVSQVSSKQYKSAQQLPMEGAIWLTPRSGPTYATALLSIFRNSFLPSSFYLPSHAQGGPQLVTPCSPWIVNAYEMAMNQDSGALKSGLLAVGLRINGQMDKSSDLNVASFQMHKQALTQLRNDLVPISGQHRRESPASSVISPYLSCLAITMFEMVQNGFSSGILQHVRALNSLIELMYADPNVDRFMADLIMEDFGMLEMMFCLKFGFASILRHTRHRLGLRRQEKKASGSPSGNASVYGDILDIVEDLPALVLAARAHRDRILQTSQDELQQIARKLLKIQVELDSWKTRFEVRYGSVMISESFLDEISGESGTRPRLRSYEHGAVGLFAYNYQLAALDASIEATTRFAELQDCQDLESLDSTGARFLDVQTSQRPVAGLGSIEQSASEQKPTFGSNAKILLHEQLKAQRTKIRTLLKQLVQVMDRFSLTVFNITGQSLMIGPGDTVRMVLNKEQTRMDTDLQLLQTGDLEGLTEYNRQSKELREASEIFETVELRLRQQFSSTNTD